MYVRKPRTKTRPKAKRYASRRSTLNSKIKAIARSVVLKTSETKVNLRVYDPQPIGHNAHTGERIGFFNLLITSQGVTDGDNDSNISNNRIGDEIIPSGMKLYITLDQFFEHPDCTYRLVVVRTKGNVSLTGVTLQDITQDCTIDPIAREQPLTVVYDKLFRCRSPMRSRHDSTLSHNVDAHIVKKVWIPLGNKKYRYSDNNSLYGLNYNMAAFIFAYDVPTTIVGTAVGNIRLATQLYFKDP